MAEDAADRLPERRTQRQPAARSSGSADASGGPDDGRKATDVPAEAQERNATNVPAEARDRDAGERPAEAADTGTGGTEPSRGWTDAPSSCQEPPGSAPSPDSLARASGPGDASGDAPERSGGPTDHGDESLGASSKSSPPEPSPTHRGGFGEHGGQAGGLIERTFRERIVLVGVAVAPATSRDVEDSLDELAELVDTAGADAVARVIQRRQAPDPATYVGRGKASEIRAVSEQIDCDTVVFDDELSPAQQLNLEKLLGRTAIDRTAVILDIFAQNAHSPEGRAQVELAQLRYQLPRLRGRGRTLSQQAGGIGARRGPGETQTEVDRRRIVRRIHHLERQLSDVRRHRDVQQKSRSRSRFAQVAIVGYTNAGKSTLLNHLTSAGVLVEDRLFATLDATTRRLQLPGGETVLVTDTVGFVKKLPHQLIQAFKTTLDVVTGADLLIHVVDASSPDPDGQVAAVRAVLDEIGARDVAEVLALNKIDRVADASDIGELQARHEGSVAISAVTGEGVDKLLDVVGGRLRWSTAPVELRIPFDRGDALAVAHREGEVLVEVTDEAGYRLRARLDSAGRARLREFVVDERTGVT